MILVTRLNGQQMALNCDLIERAESNPDTVLTLVDGTKYVITETLDQLIDSIRAFRASVLALGARLEVRHADHDAPVLRLIPGSEV